MAETMSFPAYAISPSSFHDVRTCSIDVMEAMMNHIRDMRLRIASVIAAVGITAAVASQLVIWQL
jgi:hypothetical protein